MSDDRIVSLADKRAERDKQNSACCPRCGCLCREWRPRPEYPGKVLWFCSDCQQFVTGDNPRGQI
jgi:hypothetical protein